MNLWLITAMGITFGCLPCVVVIVRGHGPERLVAVQLVGTFLSMILLLLAVGLHHPLFSDLALASALLSCPSGVLFAKFFEHRL